MTGGGEVTAVALLLRPARGSFSLLGSAIVVDFSPLPGTSFSRGSVLLPPLPAPLDLSLLRTVSETVQFLTRRKLCKPVLVLQGSIHPDGSISRPNADDSKRRISLRTADSFVQ